MLQFYGGSYTFRHGGRNILHLHIAWFFRFWLITYSATFASTSPKEKSLFDQGKVSSMLTLYSESFIFFTFCFYSYKMVSENLTSLLLTCGKWSIFLVKVKAKVLVLTTTLFFFRNFYIFLVYIKLIVNRNSYVMKIKTKRST